MNREVAINLGDQTKNIYIEEIMNISVTFSLLLSLPLLLIFIGLDILPEGTLSQDVYNYRFHIFAYIFLNQIKWFFMRYLRLFEKYIVISILELVSNVVMVLGVLFFAEKYLLDAVIYTALFASIVGLFIGFTKVTKVRYAWDIKKLKHLILAGIPMVLYALSEKVFTSVDRFMIAQYLPRSDLGYYQFGNSIALGVMMSIEALTFIFYPKFLNSFHYKTEEGMKEKKDSLIKIIYYMEYFSTLIILVGVLLVPIFIRFIMPNYSNSIIIATILLMGFCFKPITFLTSTFLVANDKQVILLPITFFAVLLLSILNYVLMITLGYGINGVVIATTIVFSIHSLILFIVIFRNFNSLYNLWRITLFVLINVSVLLLGLPTLLLIPLWLLLYIYRTKKIINLVRVNFYK